MIVIAGTISVKAETREEAVQAALVMQRATQQEEGCLAYRFHADLEDPNTFFLFEEWESQKHLDAHFKTEHMKVFRSVIPKLFNGPSDLKYYVIESSRPI